MLSKEDLEEIRKIVRAELNAKRESKKPARAGIVFAVGKFDGITEEQELRWQEAYPAVPIPPAIAQAAAWLHANPANAKRNNERFLVNWFSRAQDKAGRVKR